MPWTEEKRNAARERMRKMNADPAFKERMRKMNADPAFKEKHAERMRKMNADPAFKERMRKLAAERMRQRQAERDKLMGTQPQLLTAALLVATARRIGRLERELARKTESKDEA